MYPYASQYISLQQLLENDKDAMYRQEQIEISSNNGARYFYKDIERVQIYSKQHDNISENSFDQTFIQSYEKIFKNIIQKYLISSFYSQNVGEFTFRNQTIFLDSMMTDPTKITQILDCCFLLTKYQKQQLKKTLKTNDLIYRFLTFVAAETFKQVAVELFYITYQILSNSNKQISLYVNLQFIEKLSLEIKSVKGKQLYQNCYIKYINLRESSINHQEQKIQSYFLKFVYEYAKLLMMVKQGIFFNQLDQFSKRKRQLQVQDNDESEQILDKFNICVNTNDCLLRKIQKLHINKP